MCPIEFRAIHKYESCLFFSPSIHQKREDVSKFAALIHMKVSQFYTTLTVLIKGVALDPIARALKQLLV